MTTQSYSKHSKSKAPPAFCRRRHAPWLPLLAFAATGCSSSPSEPGTTGYGDTASTGTSTSTSASSTTSGGDTTGGSTSGGGGTSSTSATTTSATSTTSATTTTTTAAGGSATSGSTTTTTTGDASTTGAAGSGGTGTAPEPVACSVALAERATTIEIAVSPSISQSNGSAWGSTGLPVILATAPGGSAKVAWSDGDNVHVTPLTAAGERAGDDWTTPGSEARGLVAHDDGAAVLVREGDQMVFRRLDATGNEQASVTLVGGGSHTTDGDRWIDDWPHNGRLAWSGTQYAAYFGQTGNHGSAGDHQGDHYSFISADGNLDSGGWDWGCSHSLDERLAHNGSTFAPVCTSDTYPGAGIWFNNRVEISNEPSITNVGGGTKLGGLVPTADGFYLNFASPDAVVFLHIDDEGSASGRVELDTSGSANFAHLAAYGDGLLAAWGEDTDLTLAVLDTSGNITEGPVAISAQAGGLDDFASYPNGDVGWAFGNGSSLQVTRVARCE